MRTIRNNKNEIKWVAELDNVQNAGRLGLVHALYQFCELTDFGHELEYAYHQLEDNLWFQGLYLSDSGHISFQLGKLEEQYCECCGPEMEYYTCDTLQMSTSQLREIVTYLNERLDIVCN